MGFLDKLFGSKASAAVKPVAVTTEKGAVYAPVSGKVEKTDSIPDPVFASCAMGPCVGVWPVDGKVYAPVSGTVSAAMPHAFGFVSTDGVEVLVHVGVDTVEMHGEGFDVLVKEGDRVTAGAPILVFDREKVEAAGYHDIVMTIVTNADEFASAEAVVETASEVEVGAKLFQTA